MIIIRKVYITLLETLLVITLVTLLAGVVGVNVRKMLYQQRFNTEVSSIVDALRLAQDLMLILNTDVVVNFSKDNDKGGIKFWLEVEKKISQAWTTEISRFRQNLTTIHLFEFEDYLKGSKDQNLVKIKFFSGGSIMSRGVIHISTLENSFDSDKGLNSYICLPGFPAPIKSSTAFVDGKMCNSPPEADFLDKMTFNTVQEITFRKPKETKK